MSDKILSVFAWLVVALLCAILLGALVWTVQWVWSAVL